MASTKLRFPETLVLTLALIVCAQLATYFLPSGEFERAVVDGRARVVPGTFHALEAAPLPWHAALTRIPLGMERAAEVIFFVLICGGVVGVLKASGAVDALLAAVLARLGGRPVLLIAGMTAVLSVGAATIGMAEEYVPFVPILAAACAALGFDAIVAVGMVYVAAGIGYAAAPHNPFTVLIAQRIAGLEPNSGAGFRWILWGIAISVGILYLARYALRVRRDAGSSYMAGVEPWRPPSGEVPALRRGQAVLLALFGVAIALFVWGCAVHTWGLVELSAIFLAVALAAVPLCAMTPNFAAREFSRGAAEMTNTALLIGFAKTIQVLLEEGHVIDAVVQALAAPLEGLGPSVAAVGMLGVQSLTNLFIPSGSAQASVTMPLMAPLGDLVGVSRQVAVLAFQCGDGLTNMLIPTNAVLMGVLALGRVPYTAWLRFILPLAALLFALFAAALVVANRLGI